MIVVAGALFDADGGILVQQRPPGKSLAGLWEFPGGKVDIGEAPRTALARELAEELGIGVDPLDLVPLGFASEAELLLLLFKVPRWTGRPTALHASALRWERVDALRRMAMPPADYPLLDVLAR